MTFHRSETSGLIFDSRAQHFQENVLSLTSRPEGKAADFVRKIVTAQLPCEPQAVDLEVLLDDIRVLRFMRDPQSEYRPLVLNIDAERVALVFDDKTVLLGRRSGQGRARLIPAILSLAVQVTHASTGERLISMTSTEEGRLSLNLYNLAGAVSDESSRDLHGAIRLEAAGMEVMISGDARFDLRVGWPPVLLAERSVEGRRAEVISELQVLAIALAGTNIIEPYFTVMLRTAGPRQDRDGLELRLLVQTDMPFADRDIRRPAEAFAGEAWRTGKVELDDAFEIVGPRAEWCDAWPGPSVLSVEMEDPPTMHEFIVAASRLGMNSLRPKSGDTAMQAAA